jgi:hypothetical protein
MARDWRKMIPEIVVWPVWQMKGIAGRLMDAERFLAARQHWPARLPPLLLGNNPHPTLPAPSGHGHPRLEDWIKVDTTANVVYLAGTPHSITVAQATFVSKVVGGKGQYVSGTDMKLDRNSYERHDRMLRRLPKALKDVIESKPGTGYRLRYPEAAWGTATPEGGVAVPPVA